MIISVDGQEVFKWGDVDQRLTVHSIRKALISSLYGIYIHRGVIDTNETLAQLGIDDIPPVLTEMEKSARIIDLLKSRSGIYHDAAANAPGMIRDRPERETYKPGEHFFYNNWDFNVLGRILEMKIEKSVYLLFKEEIADKIGMEDYRGFYSEMDGESDNYKIPDNDGFYQFEKSKSNFPAYHFRLSARDLHRYGLLYLNKGKWEGKEIIPEAWIDISTQPYSVTNPNYGIGYGMLWYVLMKNEFRSNRSFFHTGTGIHMLGVYPSAKVVLVHRVNTEMEYRFGEEDFYKMISLAWDAKTN